MYPRLKGIIETAVSNDMATTKEIIRNITCKEAMSNWYFKSLMTKAAKDLISSAPEDAKIPRDAIQKMDWRITRAGRKRIAEALDKLEDAGANDIPESFTVCVEWNRSKNYGMNPTATLYTGGCTTTGRASGCGYDKESASVAYAMNKNSVIRRLWYDHAEIGGEFAYSMMWDAKNPKSLPCMDGGCGMSSVIKVFEELGYTCEEAHGKTFDRYHFERKK